MLRIFRQTAGPHHLVVSMVGVRTGDRLLQLGCSDGRAFAALAAKVGLTGRACALDEDSRAADRARSAAAKAGVLVEVEVAPFRMLPYGNESFDLVVIRDLLATMRPEERVGCVQEALRALRPGGRCLVIEPASRGGIGALFSRRAADPHYISSGGAQAALREEGFKVVRLLAEREGLAFFEGIKGRETERA